MAEAYERTGGDPPPGSALDQLGLRDGGDRVNEYLAYGEPELALEHLVYMISEAGLPISAQTFDQVEGAGTLLEVDSTLWESIRPTPP